MKTSPGFKDSAEMINYYYDEKFANAGDSLYRIRTEAGRKAVIKDLKEYIKNLNDELDGLQNIIDTNTKQLKEFKEITYRQFAAGIISKEQYEQGLKCIKRSQEVITNYERELKKRKSEYLPLIDDANTIIKINRQ